MAKASLSSLALAVPTYNVTGSRGYDKILHQMQLCFLSQALTIFQTHTSQIHWFCLTTSAGTLSRAKYCRGEEKGTPISILTWEILLTILHAVTGQDNYSMRKKRATGDQIIDLAIFQLTESSKCLHAFLPTMTNYIHALLPERKGTLTALTVSLHETITDN